MQMQGKKRFYFKHNKLIQELKLKAVRGIQLISNFYLY